MHNKLSPEDEKIVRRIRFWVRAVLWSITIGFFGFIGFLFWAASQGRIAY